MKSSFLSDVIRVALTNIFIIIFGLCTSIITARYLGPEKNGIIAALLVYPTLFMSIGSLGIRQSTTYFLGKKIYLENDIKTAITQIWFFTSLLSLIICFFLMYFFSNSNHNFIWIILTLIPIPFSLFNTYNSGIFLGKSQIATFNRINWIPNFLILASTVALVVILEFDVSGYLVSMIFGPFVMFFVLLFKNQFIRSFNFKFDWIIIKSMLSLGSVYALALLIINLNYRVDIILLDKLSSPFELGIYSKGAAITQYLWQIPMLLSTVVFSRSAVSKDDKLFSHQVSILLRYSIVIIGFASLFLFFISDYLIVFMYGEKFEGSIEVLKILLPGVLVLTLFKVMNTDLAGKGKPWVSMKAMIPALIINIIINILFIPKYGAVAASWSSTISYSVSGILFLIFYCKETGLTFKDVLFFKKSDFTPLIGLKNKLFK